MRLDFDPNSPIAERDDLARRQFSGLTLDPQERGPRLGGRTHALNLLTAYDASRYGKSRNFLDAPVSRLSMYLRHGMISITELRDLIRSRYDKQPEIAEEYLKQLTWRDFFEKALDWYGAALQDDLEPARHGAARRVPLPVDIATGRTGLPCMDGILSDLFETGYLHNHERLWFAAYVCHWRGIKWTEGAKLFRQHLYDGDFASNSASWQWVEGTFANKPYFMNRENIARYSGDRWCSTCPVVCPFKADYPTLERRLFSGGEAPLARQPVRGEGPKLAGGTPPPEPPPTSGKADSVVWVHDAAMSSEDPALKANPTAAVVFAFDEDWLRAEPWNFHRVAFVLDGLADLFETIPNPVKQVRLGNLAAEVGAFAREVGATAVHVTDHPAPGVRETAAGLERDFAVTRHARPALTQYDQEPVRFMRFWDKVAPQVLGYKPSKSQKHHK